MTSSQKLNISTLNPIIFLFLIWITMFWETLSSMVSLWIVSDSYTHAFLILPISLFLIWEKRVEISQVDKKSNFYFTFLILGCVIGWVLADSVNINVIRHFMAVLIIPFAIGAIYGYKLFKLLIFPLFYLLFAVPFGDFLIPKLQDVTAYITVLGIELSGIPVYWEGLFITIPSGDFEVAVACSGIRYLIASLALGTLFAYMTYQKFHKRIIFILLAIIVPIIANGIRAYGIVMIAHLSNMEYATGFDHLIYGWVFFGFVIFILFFIGNRWADEVPKLPKLDSSINSLSQFKASKLLLLTLVLLMGVSPLVSTWFAHQSGKINKTIQLNNVLDSQDQSLSTKWSPLFDRADIEIKTNQLQNQKQIDLYIAYYANQLDNKKLVTSTHQLYSQDNFKLIQQQQRIHDHIDGKFILQESLLTDRHQKRLVWSWYYVNNYSSANTIKVKLWQAYNKLVLNIVDGSFIAISTQYDNENLARKVLAEFIEINWPKIKGEIDK